MKSLEVAEYTVLRDNALQKINLKKLELQSITKCEISQQTHSE